MVDLVKVGEVAPIWQQNENEKLERQPSSETPRFSCLPDAGLNDDHAVLRLTMKEPCSISSMGFSWNFKTAHFAQREIYFSLTLVC
jgi:hypothetical protein